MKTKKAGGPSATAPVQREADWPELPAGLASRLDALGQRHPDKSRRQIVVQLLNWALAEHERSGSLAIPGAPAVQTTAPALVYLPTGPFAEFHGLGFKRHLASERELDIQDEQACPPDGERTLGDTG